jgi:hypothetical protein
MLTVEQAEHLANAALGHVTREYPNKLEHVLTGPEDLLGPRALHPVFFGSYDWHSCVHAHWLLARLARRYPTMAAAERIRGHFATAFTPDNIAVELAYLARPSSGTFERPYGWAWLLMLAAELRSSDERVLTPLAEAFALRFVKFLPKATYPVRSGVHSNSAFALALALDYARTCDDDALAAAVIHAARQWFVNDADCQAWEPGGEDFLSPALIEAECMRRVLPAEEFSDWFAGFLPRLAQREPRALFQPVSVSDRSDGRIAHLDGLNLSRAWCWNSLATTLPAADPRARLMREAAAQHLEASIRHITDDYMGEHWLATFALLALEA